MPQVLKPAVTKALIELLAPIQEEYEQSQEWQDIQLKAYPPPEVKKKEKKVKNLGSRFPGAGKGVEAQPDGHLEGKGAVTASLAIDGKAAEAVNLAHGAQEAMANLDLAPKGPS